MLVLRRAMTMDLLMIMDFTIDSFAPAMRNRQTIGGGGNHSCQR
jgi:hypothetical protein